MPSWQARLFALGVRAGVRRRDWGDGRALARKARVVFGAPPLYRSLAAWGVRHERVHAGPVRGEWLVPTALCRKPRPR